MKALLLALLLLSPLARAEEVLFIDLNNSPKELEAARAAAAKSKRKFVVFPEVPDSARRQAIAIGERRNAMMRTFTKQCSDSAKAQTDPCVKLANAATALYTDQAKALADYQFNKDKLKEFLAERERGGKTFSSVVISGHDGTGSFSGDLGSFGDQALAEVMADLPRMKSGIRALHLWGCYTTSPGSLMLNWKKHFPEVALITGYDGRAPLNDKPAGWQYLKGVIEREPELFQIRDHKKLKALLSRIPGAKVVHAAIHVCEEYANHKDSFNFGEMGDRCETYKKQLEASAPTYDCFFRATEEKCDNPPANTGSGEVRQFYEILHRATACAEMNTDPVFRAYNRDAAIRLVFSRDVHTNFGRIYAKELGEYDQLLSDLGAPASLRFSGVGKMTRGELVKKIEALQAFLRANDPDPFSDPKTLPAGEREAKLLALAALQTTLTSTLVEMSPNCVPFNWTEHNKNDISPCAKKELMGYAGLAQQLTDRAAIARSSYYKMATEMRAKLEESEAAGLGTPQAAARHAQMQAMLERISAYTYNSNEGDGAIYREQAERHVRWADLMKARTDAGVQNPGREPEALKITHEYNAEYHRMYGKAMRARVADRKRDLAAAAEDKRADIAHSLALEELELEIQEKSLEATGYLLDGVANTAQEERLKALKAELGPKLVERENNSLKAQIVTQQALLERYRSMTPVPMNEVLDASSKIGELQQKIDGDPAARAAELVDKQLYRPRFRDAYEVSLSQKPKAPAGGMFGFGSVTPAPPATGGANAPDPRPFVPFRNEEGDDPDQGAEEP